MTSATRREDENPDGIEFIREDDGTITAWDLETGLARGGDTHAEALAQLAEVLALAAGDGESIEDPETFLSDIGIDAGAADKELPGFLQ